MTFAELWQETVQAVRTSPILHGAVSTGKILFIGFAALLVLFGVTYLLKLFFHRYTWIRRAHRLVIYLLTMLGVLILLFAGIVGIFLPVIPGLLFLLLALLLLRRYYRSHWVDGKIRYLSWKLRFRRTVKRVRRGIKRSKIGKALRKARPDRRAGD